MKYYLEFDGLIQKRNRDLIADWLTKQFQEQAIYEGAAVTSDTTWLLVDVHNIDLEKEDLGEIPFQSQLQSVTPMNKMLMSFCG